MNDGVFTYRGVVYPWQCDQMGHMNVMWYTGKCDEATWAFFDQLGLNQKFFTDNNRGMAAVEIKFTYKAEVLAGEVVQVRTKLKEIRGKVIKFDHIMSIGRDEKTACIAEVTGVHMDTEKRKAIAFPDFVLDRGNALLEVN